MPVAICVIAAMESAPVSIVVPALTVVPAVVALTAVLEEISAEDSIVVAVWIVAVHLIVVHYLVETK